MKKLLNSAIIYAIAALAGGVFYREFTKFNGFTGQTTLGVLHTHLFLLGMVFFLLLLCLDKSFGVSARRGFRTFFIIYHAGMLVTITGLVWRGVTQVLQISLSAGMDAAISGVSGIGHILLGIGILWYLFLLRKQVAKRAHS